MTAKVYGEVLSMTIFKGLEKDEVIQNFYRLLKNEDIDSYSRFVSSLYEQCTDNWTQYLIDKVFALENCLVSMICENRKIPKSMMAAAEYELSLLDRLSQMVPDDFKISGFKASWIVEYIDLKNMYFERLSHIDKYGFGQYARYTVFRLEPNEKESFSIKPVEASDTVRFKDLIGYDLQRQQLISNTEILLNGYKASNVLLYGDAGTGKSASVKAVVNEYASLGLRLIEVSKKDLHFLPKLLDILSNNPLKFVLFIDDLSFQDNDDDFNALKAVLEGSASVRSNNTVIYCTSNRRHLVKETFQARYGDEIHRNDTMQETISLSERFGMKIYFEKPKKDLYLEIVRGLAKQYNLEIADEELILKAEQFALRKAGRSARAARQLIEQLSSESKKEIRSC